MRRLIVFALVALALTLTGVGLYAAPTKSSTKHVTPPLTEIKGIVTKVTAKTLRVKDELAKSHRIKSDSKLLKGITVGDKVDVKLEKGRATSIEKVEAAMSEPTPNFQNIEQDWGL